jgi:flagellar hook-associated protein 3 FlgL
MRVTHMMIRDTMLRSLTTNAGRLEKLQEQITTGKKINRPSDDPVTAAAVLRSAAYRFGHLAGQSAHRECG